MKRISVLFLVFMACLGCRRPGGNAPAPYFLIPPQTVPTVTDVIIDEPIDATEIYTTATETDLVIPPEQLAILNEAHDALAELAKKSPRAAFLLAFYEEQAVPAMTMPDQQVRVVTVPKSSQTFFVAVNKKSDGVIKNGHGTIYALFDCYPHPFLGVHNVQINRLMKGLLFAHELSHAEDCIVNGEPPSETRSDINMTGEIAAYMTSIEILHDVTDGRWDELVEQTRALRVKGALVQGAHAESLTFGLPQESLDAIRKLFPNLDENSLDAFATHLDLSANFSNIHLQGTQHQKTDEEILAYSINYMRMFFERAGRFN